MEISIILAHPDPDSFNHAIANTAADALRPNGHQVVLHDLYHEKFPPLFPMAELQTNARLNPVVARHCAEIAKVSTPQKRAQWLAEVRKMVERVFVSHG